MRQHFDRKSCSGNRIRAGAELSDLMTKTTWYTGQQAVDAGFADTVGPSLPGGVPQDRESMMAEFSRKPWMSAAQYAEPNLLVGKTIQPFGIGSPAFMTPTERATSPADAEAASRANSRNDAATWLASALPKDSEADRSEDIPHYVPGSDAFLS